MSRYYESIVKRMPDMSMEAYLEAIEVGTFLRKKDENLYKTLINIKIREFVNRGYFMNRSELREELTEIYRKEGLDRAVTFFSGWANTGMLHEEKNSKSSDLTEAQMIHIVKYNCDFHYRIVRLFHRKLMTELKRLNKLDLKITDDETLKDRLRAINENIEKVEEPVKRDEPLKVIDDSVIGVKSIIEENNIPEEKVHPEGDLALWYNGWTLKVVNRDYNREEVLNRDYWWRLHVSNKVARIFDKDCKLGDESYSHSSGDVKGKLSLNKNKELVLKWKHYMIDMWNARYGKNVSYDAIVPNENDIVKNYYRNKGSK